MKFSILTLALALGVSHATPVFAENDELMAALQNLSNRADIARRTYLATPRKISNFAIGSGLTLMLLDAGRAAGDMKAVRKATYFGAGILLAGIAAHYAVAYGQYVAIPRRLANPQIVQTQEDLMFYFARPLHEQYVIAKTHPELAEFIIQLSRSYEFIDTALPGHKVVTPQVKRSAG